MPGDCDNESLARPEGEAWFSAKLDQLRVGAADQERLRRQGFVSAERTRGGGTRFKLRYRDAANRQRVRCLGRDAGVAARVKAALGLWQSSRRLAAELRDAQREVAGERRVLRRQASSVLEPHGYYLHGATIRRRRSGEPGIAALHQDDAGGVAMSASEPQKNQTEPSLKESAPARPASPAPQEEWARQPPPSKDAGGGERDAAEPRATADRSPHGTPPPNEGAEETGSGESPTRTPATPQPAASKDDGGGKRDAAEPLATADRSPHGTPPPNEGAEETGSGESPTRTPATPQPAASGVADTQRRSAVPGPVSQVQEPEPLPPLEDSFARAAANARTPLEALIINFAADEKKNNERSSQIRQRRLDLEGDPDRKLVIAEATRENELRGSSHVLKSLQIAANLNLESSRSARAKEELHRPRVDVSATFSGAIQGGGANCAPPLNAAPPFDTNCPLPPGSFPAFDFTKHGALFGSQSEPPLTA